jgi:hypothetical protein
MPLALGLAQTAAVLSGAAALVYEVVWLRMLSPPERYTVAVSVEHPSSSIREEERV